MTINNIKVFTLEKACVIQWKQLPLTAVVAEGYIAWIHVTLPPKLGMMRKDLGRMY